MKILLIICMCHCVLGSIDRTWWKNTTIYQVFLPSFMDGDGDGFGDLKGLISRLDYLEDYGIKTVMMTPHFPSPNMQYAGYDVIDYMDVNTRFGSMKDFKILIREMKNRGIKLIIDMVINHSSDQHPWFIKSINREYPHTDYYIWKDASGYDTNGNPIPPNNWFNVFSGNAWTWNSKRKQFYLHQFIEQMPDLNLRNDYVWEEIKDIFEFWSKKGVAGFRLDAAEHFMEDSQFRNEPFIDPSRQELRGRYDQANMFTQLLSESVEFVHRLRNFLDHLSARIGDFERILIPETNTLSKELYQYYGSRKYKVTHFPLNFGLARTRSYETAYYYHNVIDGYIKCLPAGAIANWDSENHDVPRRAEVFNEEYEFILTTMVLLLPGVSFLYYGQELGLAGWKFEDGSIPSHRLPMQWDDTKNAGFSNNSHSYLPVSLNYEQINVKKQKFEENSHYNKVKKMISWRKTDVFEYGSFKSHVISQWVYSFTRRLGDDVYLMIFNLGTNTEYVELNRSIDYLPNAMIIQLASRNSDHRTGSEINTNEKFMLKPHVAVILGVKNK